MSDLTPNTIKNYQCECSDVGCGSEFVDPKDYEVGDTLCKNNLEWRVISPHCKHQTGLFPVFFDPKNRFVLINADRSIGGCLAY